MYRIERRELDNPISWTIQDFDASIPLVDQFPTLLLKGKVIIENVNDHPVVKTIAGYPAYIPCNVSTPLAEDEASLILWYRTDNPNPIYTLDVRNARIQEARHFPAEELKGRAYFNISRHPPILRIATAKAEDEADYKCRVDLKRSRTLILHTRLDVIVPPGEPIIMDEHGQSLHDIIGPFDEGSTLIFICEVDGGDPSPKVTWWRGNTLVDDDFSIIKQRFVRNEMVVRDISRSDFMAEYTCKAWNNNVTKPKEASVIIDINLLPLEVNILGPNLPMMAGEEQEIVCETKGSRPNALTTWWLDGQKINISPPEEDEEEESNVTISILKFRPSPDDNGKLLVCKSANPALPKSTIQTEVKLQVEFIPILNLTIGRSSRLSEIREGKDVYLECHTKANPWYLKLYWIFEGRPLQESREMGIFIMNQTLLLRKVRKEHRGRYQCIARNTVGEGQSNILNLLVQCK
ncbi:nephrin-like [Stegodyphus dumicola]|uniref:nephrin-like n=1 Tax=Stegodyphus dumicola TaxID=202533 RepID=UPI0015B129F6|nr:nephrin-like [Stegodyphus dumicola]